MSFHATGEGFHVENHVLKGRLRNAGGATVDAHINLDDFIGNEDGKFHWGGNSFSKTAENIHFAIEGGASVPVLRARLRKLDGSYVDSDVNLAERIKNQDGRFVFE